MWRDGMEMDEVKEPATIEMIDGLKGVLRIGMMISLGELVS